MEWMSSRKGRSNSASRPMSSPSAEQSWPIPSSMPVKTFLSGMSFHAIYKPRPDQKPIDRSVKVTS